MRTVHRLPTLYTFYVMYIRTLITYESVKTFNPFSHLESDHVDLVEEEKIRKITHSYFTRF